MWANEKLVEALTSVAPHVSSWGIEPSDYEGGTATVNNRLADAARLLR
jgi:hypothetical protein